MWDYIKEMPADLVGQKILSFLDIKSIALLERALTSTVRLSTLHSFLKFSPTLSGSVSVPRQFNKLKWLQDRHCRIAEGVVCLQELKAVVDFYLFDEITLHIKYRILPKQIEMLSIAAYNKCFKVIIDVDQDSVTMLKLFSRLKNMHAFSAKGYHDNWMRDALGCGNRTGLQHITLFSSSSRISHRTVTAIAKHCPNLQSLNVNRFDNISAALFTLSKRRLPRKALSIVQGLPELRVEHAAHCAHALSRISELSFHPSTDNRNLPGLLPYLTGMKELCANSKDDHVLLPILIVVGLPLERVMLGEYSSTTAEQVMELVQSCSGSLTVLHLKHTSPTVTNAMVTALVPHSPHLQELVVGSFRTSTSMDSCVLALSWHCPQLRELNMYCHGKASEITLLQLIAACPQLQVLGVPVHTLPPYLSKRLFQCRNKQVQWGTLKPHSTIAPWVAMRIAMLSLHCYQAAPQHLYTLDTLIRKFQSLF